ncbi:MAG: DUF3822 family protein [Tannerellaceae bacterium]|jgi:hypothetical protein|nr:DUF3822 family protein [Tannerellaceae bacterium]
MMISVPDTLTTDNSEKYIMSIRLWSDGLSFSAYNPSEGQSFFYREVAFDRKIPYTTSLKEVFFMNECLVWTYKRTYVLCQTLQYTLAPEDKAQDKLRFLSFNFSSPEKRCLDNYLKDEKAKLIFGMNDDVYEFCARTLTNPLFTHHVTSQLITLKKQVRDETLNHVFVVVHRRIVDIICFKGTRLLLANSFEFEQLNDLLYYILCVWKQTEMDQLNDRLLLSGEISLCTKVTGALQTYIRHIGRMELPAKAYLLGGEIRQAPMDLILMLTCE